MLSLIFVHFWGPDAPPRIPCGARYLFRCHRVLNKNVKSANFNIDTINQKIYVFGIAHDENEKKEIIQEAKQIVDVKEVVTSILMVSNLSRQRE